MNELVRFSPGDLVQARGREWVVLPGTENETLRVRPLSGTEADSQKHPLGARNRASRLSDVS